MTNISNLQNISKEQYDYLINLKLDNSLDTFLNSSELIKINKITSLYSFTLKEYIKYIMETTPQGIPIYYLKNVYQEVITISNRLEYINKIILSNWTTQTLSMVTNTLNNKE